MRCPSCGEPVETRHTFCTVCGADLQGLLPRPGEVSVRSAASLLRSVLTKPIVLRKPAAGAPAVMRQAPAPEPRRTAESEQSVILPDFMKHFVT